MDEDPTKRLGAEPGASAPAGAEQPAPGTAKATPSSEKPALTPEEQMALFEKELKENDWGHQPC